MDITKKVAKMRLIYHSNMLDVCNVANQLGIIKDDKAERVMIKHVFETMDCLNRLGLLKTEFKEILEKRES